jgi:hypothetical protein
MRGKVTILRYGIALYYSVVYYQLWKGINYRQWVAVGHFSNLLLMKVEKSVSDSNIIQHLSQAYCIDDRGLRPYTSTQTQTQTQGGGAVYRKQ